MSLPIDQIIPVVELAAEGINVGHKLSKKAGLFALAALSDELSAFTELSFKDFWAQVQECDEGERAQINAAFKDKLVLSDKVLEAQIEKGSDILLEKAVRLVFRGKDLLDDSKALYEEVKALVTGGVVPV